MASSRHIPRSGICTRSKLISHDTELAGTWRGVTDAMLIFVRLRCLMDIQTYSKQTGLFSAVVAAFIIETYKMLLPTLAAQR